MFLSVLMEENVWNKLIPTLVQIPQMNPDKKLWRTFRSSQNSLEKFWYTVLFVGFTLCVSSETLQSHKEIFILQPTM